MSSISDLFNVSTYAVPSRSTTSNSSIPHVTTTTSGADSHITVTVAYNGIHIIDLTTSHPVFSYTLGPQTHFSCPAVSRLENHPSGTSQRKTYVVVEGSPELPIDHAGRAVWVWAENLGGDTQSTEPTISQKQVFQVSSRIASLIAPESLRNILILVSPNGSITTTSSNNLSEIAQRDISATKIKYNLLQTYCFLDRECSFADKKHTNGLGVTVVTSSSTAHLNGAKLFISATSVSESGNINSNTNVEIDIPGAGVSGMALSATRHMTVLTSNLELLTFTLNASSDNQLNITPSSQSLKLNASRFHVGSKHSTTSCTSLSDTRILLTCLSEQDKQVHILIWDLRYNVLLASKSINIPSSVCCDGISDIVVDVSTAGPSQAILVLSTATPSKKRRSSNDLSRESVIFSIPYTVPSRSNLSSVVGKGDAGNSWLATSATPDLAGAIIRPEEVTLIKGMSQKVLRSEDEEGLRKAEELFEDYLQQISNYGREPNLSSLVSHEFICAALKILLPVAANPGQKYLKTPSVVLRLISNRVVSQIQLAVDGGVVGALHRRGDWIAIETALKFVPDISEDTLIQLLSDVTIAHLSATGPVNDAMDIDQPASSNDKTTSIPSLAYFLDRVMKYPVSLPALRIALRKHLKVEHATAILEVLDSKIESFCGADLLKPMDNTFGQTILFVQTVLDTFLIQFLQYSPSHNVLKSLSDKLSSESDTTEQLGTLLVPLGQFAKAEEETKSKKSTSGQLDRDQWMTKRNQRRGAAEMNIGDYQVEDLVF